MQGSCARKHPPATRRELYISFSEQRLTLLSMYSAGNFPGVETVEIVRVGCLVDRDKTDLESGPLRAVHLPRHKWPGGLVNLVVLPHALDRAVPVELLHLHGQVLRARRARLQG